MFTRSFPRIRSTSRRLVWFATKQKPSPSLARRLTSSTSPETWVRTPASQKPKFAIAAIWKCTRLSDAFLSPNSLRIRAGSTAVTMLTTIRMNTIKSLMMTNIAISCCKVWRNDRLRQEDSHEFPPLLLCPCPTLLSCPPHGLS